VRPVSSSSRVPFGTPGLTRRPIKFRPCRKRSRAHSKRHRSWERKPPPKPRSSESPLNFISMDGGKEWENRRISQGDTARGMTMRWSPRWGTRQKFIQTSVQLPYIDKVGKYTGCALYTASMHPASFVGTMVATIHRRLYFYASRHYGHRTAGRMNKPLLACASYYAVSKNSYYWDRLLALVRKRVPARQISAHLSLFVRRLDDYRWFVYNRCCQQANWLTVRAVRPRGKSSLVSRGDRPPVREAYQQDAAGYEYDSFWFTFVKMNQL
jgi:hypothetical protein